ncbi:MAG: autotransporter outer membrane beta-barrel domain-containing protein [Caulobacterales bacterium]
MKTETANSNATPKADLIHRPSPGRIKPASLVVKLGMCLAAFVPGQVYAEASSAGIAVQQSDSSSGADGDIGTTPPSPIGSAMAGNNTQQLAPVAMLRGRLPGTFVVPSAAASIQLSPPSPPGSAPDVLLTPPIANAPPGPLPVTPPPTTSPPAPPPGPPPETLPADPPPAPPTPPPQQPQPPVSPLLPTVSQTALIAPPSTINSQALAASQAGFAFLQSMALDRPSLREGEGWWGDVFGAQSARDGDGQSLGYEHQSQGATMGLIRQTSEPNWRVGLALGWAHTDLSLDAGAGAGEGEGDQDVLLAALFVNWSKGASTLGGGIKLGHADQTMHRTVTFNTATSAIESETTSLLAGAFVSATQFLAEFKDWHLDGHVDLAVMRQMQDGFSERGSNPLRLAVEDLTLDTGEISAGFTLERTFDISDRNNALLVRFGIGASHQDALDDRQIQVRFIDSNASAQLHGDTSALTRGHITSDLAWTIKNGVYASFNYQGEFADVESSQARLGIVTKF